MRKYGVLLATFLVCGCIGVSPQSKFYGLNSISESSITFDSAKLAVGVGEVKVPAYLDKPQIVTRQANQVELNVSEFHRWSEPLSAVLRQALTDDLAVYLPNAMVKPTSFRREGFNYVLWVEVNKFDGTWGKTADLSVWWSVFDANNNLVLREKTDLSRPLGKTYDDLMQQDSDLVSELAREMAAKIAKLKK